MIIIFDTETAGLPANWNEPASDGSNWPRMVQLAWQMYRDDGRKVSEHNYIIKPEGFEIPAGVSEINHITTERALKEGFPAEYVLQMFGLSLLVADTIVAHNISFDERIVGSEFLRSNMGKYHDVLFEKERICTMHSTTDFCDLIGPRGKKWPKLSELHEKLFGHSFEGAHDALVDVEALSRCYFELKKRCIIGGQVAVDVASEGV